MGNERNIGHFAVNRRRIVTTFAALSTVVMFGAASDSASQGHEAYAYTPVPQSDFVPLQIQEELKDNQKQFNMDNSSGEKITVVLPSPLVTPEPSPSSSPTESPSPSVPVQKPVEIKVLPKPTSKPKVAVAPKSGKWTFDSNVSWYGPGFYGHRTACGEILTKTLIGVANKTLPCGTLVDFKVKGSDGVTREIIVPVVDRGPYVAGRQWDLTGGLALYFHRTYTGPLFYDIIGK